jgi:hypothetical protein
MPTATIQTIRCVRSSGGIDSGVFDALATLPATVAPDQIDALIRAVAALPGVVEAIDAARNDPDNLYITTDTSPGRDNALWPGVGELVEMRPDQSIAPDVTVAFDTTQNLSLWDYDTVSRDDLLGSIMMAADEQGQGVIGRLASSSVEGSLYYIIYRVD